MSCTILLLVAAGALTHVGSPLGFSTGADGPNRQRQQSKLQQSQQLQQRQQQQRRQASEQPSALKDLQVEKEVSDEELAAVWRLPAKDDSLGESEQGQAAKHAFWARQKATPLRDQAAQRSALRLPGLHEQVKRALHFHEDRLAREKAASDEFDPDNADHVATLMYRVFTLFVLWAGAMNAMAVWDPSL